ncbi:hypothetical protein HMPREF0432_01558 [Gemella morbillorum M424]|uniref:DUF421 domain-containing protein n=1 Tax=Gemella morbillorum TaxID=29391 RepID=A0AAP9HCY8_9BACL|nr:DUF421 domain-containing protein [Gemella morbillorum]EFV34771.1 hypothetical protein HMPREF0432_01558 [Gemella morbillorum M424]QGS09112.1 DUF421 domain-containing protein [Gemella morbillorum]
MQLSYIDIAIKLALGLLSLVFVINVSGKGNLAPASASDQVQNYVLGGIIGGVIYNPSISILQFINILLIWVILVLTQKWLKTTNMFLKKMVDGEPTTVIKRGKINVEATRKSGLSANDLAFKLRSQGIYSIKNVKRAVIEQNGQLIVVLAGDKNPKYPIITDGKVQINSLESMDKTEEWLMSTLKEMGYKDIKNIFLAEYDKGQLHIVEY